MSEERPIGDTQEAQTREPKRRRRNIPPLLLLALLPLALIGGYAAGRVGSVPPPPTVAMEEPAPAPEAEEQEPESVQKPEAVQKSETARNTEQVKVVRETVVIREPAPETPTPPAKNEEPKQEEKKQVEVVPRSAVRLDWNIGGDRGILLNIMGANRVYAPIAPGVEDTTIENWQIVEHLSQKELEQFLEQLSEKEREKYREDTIESSTYKVVQFRPDGSIWHFKPRDGIDAVRIGYAYAVCREKECPNVTVRLDAAKSKNGPWEYI